MAQEMSALAQPIEQVFGLSSKLSYHFYPPKKWDKMSTMSPSRFDGPANSKASRSHRTPTPYQFTKHFAKYQYKIITQDWIDVRLWLLS